MGQLNFRAFQSLSQIWGQSAKTFFFFFRKATTYEELLYSNSCVDVEMFIFTQLIQMAQNFSNRYYLLAVLHTCIQSTSNPALKGTNGKKYQFSGS